MSCMKNTKAYDRKRNLVWRCYEELRWVEDRQRNCRPRELKDIGHMSKGILKLESVNHTLRPLRNSLGDGKGKVHAGAERVSGSKSFGSVQISKKFR